MSEQFNVGEIAILICDPTESHDDLLVYNREDVEVRSPLQRHFCHTPDRTSYAFVEGFRVIALIDGREFVARPHELRKKKPPEADTGEQRIMSLFVPVKAPEMEPA